MPRPAEWAEAEIRELRGAKAALQAEIERLRKLNDDQQKIIDGTERREAEYLALVEKHATEVERLKAGQDWQRGEIERLKAERHTVKRMLQDLLEKHDPGHRPQLTLIGKPPSG
jgi:chromosome segregation ATPase